MVLECTTPMADNPYIVALALFEQKGARAMPLAGKSQKTVVAAGDQPEELGRSLILELLLRVWQRSENGPLKRACGVKSLLLVELAMERLPEDLPALKAAWLNSGDTEAFRAGLRAMCGRAWTMSIAKFQPVTLTPWTV